MRVVVTGGSGQVGDETVRHLVEHGYEVVNFDRKRPEERRCRFMDIDLEKAEDVYDALAQIRPGAVVHLAADPVSHGRLRRRLFGQNVMSTFHVMQAAADLGVKHVVYGSSEMANGWSSAERAPRRVPFGIEDRTPPPNTYALSKLVGEVIADSMSAEHPELSFVSLRINGVVHTDRDEWPARNARTWPGSHSTLWGYIDVRDVASACRLAIERGKPGHRRYMIAAADALLDRPTREAVREFFGPEVEVDPIVGEFGSCIDCRPALLDLGWSPEFSWRKQIPSDSA